jgi:hypothetical protein
VDGLIGYWIARFSDRTETRQLTKWHLVESEITDRKVTKCGRQMGEIAGTAVAPVVTPPSLDVTCSRCNPQA